MQLMKSQSHLLPMPRLLTITFGPSPTCRMLSVLCACAVSAAGVPAAGAQGYSGLMANGKVVSVGPREKPPWADDIIRRVGPEYPRSQRERYNEGHGVFRGTIDLKTGNVTAVTVTKSTGHSALDRSVVTAMRQWRFRPGRWKAFVLPVSFEMARSRAEAIEKMRLHRAQDQKW